LRSAFGLLLLLAGIAMLVLPGQGILTILIGIGLMEFPGKFALECRLAGIPSVYRALNWIRRKGGQSDFSPPARQPK
ncbi:MAG: PGPGW domain-containing protein, partial [Gammaproteobacteria bacterium]